MQYAAPKKAGLNVSVVSETKRANKKKREATVVVSSWCFVKFYCHAYFLTSIRFVFRFIFRMSMETFPSMFRYAIVFYTTYLVPIFHL